ncbi:acetoin dehydrogenase dihydrolipoyllysine-residue acetyltransferase subunit [Swaminathania salitolerans]|uniref:Acetoin dehydrogenase dihydrolipoyllysine-residue acetyltransferase subunit n=1 Tax=Swaminathania salitolerans TaxID=182838 RepID=A0A511BR19_9PROT|nr:acetoin dehydrogenase dihydrolipoyllysine-residue acetyltransferase subunit [Swaminathania salitolerans]GBQ11561.1 branched-chain alpha-keto acid dehydrogenase subunit E2 [Swaminathania salitolerans LMG 21291]GEL02532.1 acetoin dehydrogenase dihydrolipoyllysine-residue acetyltransferase subunit [Swaminathania salitolerans]
MHEGITPVTMPKFGLAMTEGTLVGWLAEPGATLAAGQDLAEIETTKITNVYESPAAGTLRRCLAAPGDTLPVGALIGVLAPDDVPEDAIESYLAAWKTAPEQDMAAETHAPETRIVEIGDLRLRIRESNPPADPETPTGAPVLLIHGFAGALENWTLVENALAATDRVIAFDLPGHGESSKSVGDGSIDHLAAVTAALLAERGIDHVHVVGHSLGGAIAIALAAHHPARVASLTLIAPVGLGETINAAFIEGILTADRRRTLEPVLAMLVRNRNLITRQMVEDMIRFKRLDGALHGLETLARTNFDGTRQIHSLRGALAGFEGRTTLLWGEDDEILPVTATQGLSGNIACRILPETGHMPQLEQAEEVVRAIRAATGNRS